MKDFDLEKAQAGAKIQTRGGHKARITCFDLLDPVYKMTALIQIEEGQESNRYYTVDGKINKCLNSELDLVMAPVVREDWMIGAFVNGDLRGLMDGLLSTEDKASRYIKENICKEANATYGAVKLTWEE